MPSDEIVPAAVAGSSAASPGFRRCAPHLAIHSASRAAPLTALSMTKGRIGRSVDQRRHLVHGRELRQQVDSQRRQRQQQHFRCQQRQKSDRQQQLKEVAAHVGRLQLRRKQVRAREQRQHLGLRRIAQVGIAPPMDVAAGKSRLDAQHG